LAEEPDQALEVLCRCSQEELLSHKLQSPQAETTQADLIFNSANSLIASIDPKN